LARWDEPAFAHGWPNYQRSVVGLEATLEQSQQTAAKIGEHEESLADCYFFCWRAVARTRITQDI